MSADPRHIVTSSLPAAIPVRHEGCDGEIAGGHGGVNPLPIMRLAGGHQSLWRLGTRAMKALRRNEGALSLVITTGPDGQPEIGIAVPTIVLIKNMRQ